MNEFRVALLQMVSESTKEANQKKGMEYCRRAKAMGADLALFPEMWSTGYTMDWKPEAMKALATAADGPFVHVFQDMAKELDMAIGITYLEQYDPLPEILSPCLIVLAATHSTYAKVHTCDFGIESQLTPGDDFYTADLNTAAWIREKSAP